MRIIAEVQLSQKGLTSNGIQKAFQEENWLKEAYINLNTPYPKYYKMDVLSKMAFICVEELKQTIPTDWWINESIPQIIANKNASTNTDLQFIESYTNEVPSPSLFVYTLPNIVTGELAIRNKWYGQNWFFILEKLDWEFLEQQIILNLYDYQGFVICGWTDIHTDLATANATFRLIEL